MKSLLGADQMIQRASKSRYSLVLYKRGGRLLIFGNFSHPQALFGPPCLLIFANFKFSACEIFKCMLSIKGILDTFCVPEQDILARDILS